MSAERNWLERASGRIALGLALIGAVVFGIAVGYGTFAALAWAGVPEATALSVSHLSAFIATLSGFAATGYSAWRAETKS